MSKIKVIQANEAKGRLKEIYEQIISTRGQLAEVHKIHSLRPESILKHMDLYMEIMYSKSELSRAEREMIAVVVSVQNKCKYCQMHHKAALNKYWKDNNKVEKLLSETNYVSFGERENLLCEFAKNLTVMPSENSDVILSGFRKLGLSDEAILDATLVIAYFNFVNRIVLALGVELEEDNGEKYEY